MRYILPEKRYLTEFYDYAMSFRSIAMLIDQYPDRITEYTHLKPIQFLLSDRTSTTLERTRYLEALSYGDPGVLLASPGPSLSGLTIRALGTPDQIDAFYHQLQSRSMRTFFGLTEIEKGSDASHITASLTRGLSHGADYVLSGTKCFCGNASVADMGVVFARTNETIAGFRAVWLTPELISSPAVLRESLPQVALKGARLGVITFHDLDISFEKQVLGHYLSPLKSGMLAIIHIFNQLRTGVGAIAVGQAQAVFDFVCQTKIASALSIQSMLNRLSEELSVARLFLHHAAQLVDDQPYDGKMVSMAKVNAVKTGEWVMSNLFQLLPMNTLLDNPWVLKAFRDMHCWEFMEGSSPVLMQPIKNNLIAMIKETGARATV